jgi:hypothetical protein
VFTHTHSWTASGEYYPRIFVVYNSLSTFGIFRLANPNLNIETANFNMGALISLPFRLLNLLLPFTRSGTPLTQDVLHTAILCGTLYFAPQIAEWYNTHQHPGQTGNRAEGPEDTQQPGEQEDVAQGNDAPLDERLVLQHDGIAPVGRPPLAPTPPPHQPHGEEGEEEEDAQNHPHPDQQAQHQLPDDAFAPGPANPQHPRPTPANRTIGTKKAKSLARRDQQRAYNEWIRSEAERRKVEENEGREEREASLAAEKARRLAVEESIREKEKEERDKRKEIERKEPDEEVGRRERVVKSVREQMDRTGAVDLVDAAHAEGKDVMWVERLIRASGLLQQLQKDAPTSHILITGRDWLVRIDADVMQQAYAEAEGFGESNGGKVGFEELGTMLEKAVLARVKA